VASPLTSRLLEEASRATKEQVALLEDAAARDLTEAALLTLLAELGRRQAEQKRLMSRVAGRLGLPHSAKPRLLRYLLLTKGKVVEKDELSGVSGIHEWARRIRELRTEEGWPIASHTERPELKPGQYVLLKSAPDEELKRRWKVANTIRRSGGSAEARLLALLRANVGIVVSADELAYVAKIHAYARRIRSLVEEGWPIQSNLDRSGLRAGDYILVKDRQRAR
jgi:hypothetical protein